MSSRTTPADVTVPARDIRFDLSSAKDGHWLGGDPVGTAVFNALSLTFPDGERMFMDSVKNYRKDLTGKLAEDVRGFIAQEAIHSREHLHLNMLIDRERYPVAEIEAAVKERTAMARDRGPMAMLVSTIALEHFTAMMAEVLAESSTLFKGVAPDIERLWRWHAMEETEHKGVAFDVFMHATRHWPSRTRYLRRVISMAIITKMFTDNITNYASRLLEADGYSPKDARKAVKTYLWRKPGLFSKGWRTYISWYRPGFHPWDHDNRALIERWKQDFAVPTVASA
jgi:predicted metal-dependent hydrolase